MTKSASRVSALGLMALIASLTLTTTASAQFTITDLHNFGSVTNDGSGPQDAPVLDSAGNLYGVASFGGADGGGIAYELSPSASGWTYSILYNFAIAGTTTDASDPNGSLILDAAGNLYGVSYGGGTDKIGTVFELTPSASGWTDTILHSFTGGADGQYPNGSLIFDAAGNLYGTTAQGGANGSGIVFELSPSSSGWTEQVIYSFTGGADGSAPGGNLLFDSSGRLYGAAALGGTVNSTCFEGCGTIFRLTNASGTWRFARLFNFPGTAGGATPVAIAFDSTGNIYGSANTGGSGCTTGIGCGTVFKLTPSASGGPWKEKVLHAFNKQEGEYPTGIAFDSKGNLYGACFNGASQNEGNVWELNPTLSGQWTFTSLVVFGKDSDGYEPNSGVIVDAKGNLYGTNSGGNTGGTVFELSPSLE